MRTMVRYMVPAAALVLLVGAACRGGDDNKKQSSEPQAVATTARSEGTQSTRTATPASTAAGRIVASDCLKGLHAYRYSGRLNAKLGGSGTATAIAGLDLSSITFNGAFVAPDRFQAKVEIGRQSFESIVIGKDSWQRSGSSAWVKSSDAGGGAFRLDPDDICRTVLSSIDGAGVTPVKDQVSGVDALRYEFDKAAISRLNELSAISGFLGELPANTKLSLWVSEKERWPLKLTITGAEGSGTNQRSIDLEYTVSDINSNITIEAPKS